MFRLTALSCVVLLVLLVHSVIAGDVPEGFAKLRLSTVVHLARTNQRPALLVHFHGAAPTTAENFRAAQLTGVLLTVNCNGLSSAYRRPFENQHLFDYVIEHTRQQLVASGQLTTDAQWGRLDVSCFSAGYGAVRELLKDQQTVERIDSVTAADSIYASIHDQAGQRLVDERQMQPFLRFAKLATRKQKHFLLTHSQLPVETYASTVETAGYLLSKLEMKTATLSPPSEGRFRPITEARRGHFVVHGFAGDDGEAHLRHLREISWLWQRIRPKSESKAE